MIDYFVPFQDGSDFTSDARIRKVSNFLFFNSTNLASGNMRRNYITTIQKKEIYVNEYLAEYSSQ
jgi:hypothetical protein